MNKDVNKTVINRAMKDFRKTKAFAKDNGVEINSIFYLGERLTPMQVDLVKQLVYALSELNQEVGKENTDKMIEQVVSQIMAEMFLESLMK